MFRFLFITTISILAFTHCDVFENEQEFDPTPECSLEYLTIPEQMPVLIGGISSLSEKIVYPREAKGSGREGRVMVQFLVTEAGKPTCITIIRSMGLIFDKAAIEAVEQVQFEPGRQNEEAVTVQYSLPVSFRDPEN